MKNTVKVIYICTIVFITVIAIGYGLYRNLGTSFKVGKFTLFGRTYSDAGKLMEETIDLNSVGSFESIKVDTAIGEFVLEEGDESQITYTYDENCKPEILVNNGELQITQKMNRKVNMNTNDAGYMLKIVVPRDSHFAKTELKLDLGSITMDDIEADELEIEADLGAVEVNDCDFGEVTIKASLGAVELKNTNFIKGDIDADLGSVEIQGNLEELKVDCSLGSVEINTDSELDLNKLDLNADLGSIKINGKTFNS